MQILNLKLSYQIFYTIFRETQDIMEYQAEKENEEKSETEVKLVSQAEQVLSA